MTNTTIAFILRIALGLAAVYVILLVLLYTFQSRLIHLPNLPGRALTATPEAIGLAYRDVTIPTDDGLELHGWFVPAREPRGTLLFFHGNAGNISHRLDSLDLFNRLDLSVLIVDYRGYGESKGRPSEQGLYRDGEAALAFLQDEFDVPAAEVVVFGRSLGAAVAAHVGAQAPVAALVLESAFTSVADVGSELYPIFPVRTLVRYRYPTIDYVERSEGPLLVIHSPEDEIIPFSHGQRLYDAGPQARLMLRIAGDHNTGFLRHRERYLRGWRQFLDDYVDGGAIEPAETDGRD